MFAAMIDDIWARSTARTRASDSVRYWLWSYVRQVAVGDRVPALFYNEWHYAKVHALESDNVVVYGEC